MNEHFQKNKKILITGASSMIGISLIEQLLKDKYIVSPIYHQDCDLLSLNKTKKRFKEIKPNIIIHLATYSGSGKFNTLYPADTFYKTSQIGLNVLRVASELKIDKILSIISSCAITEGENELNEEDLHKGKPSKNIESHGYAKRILDIYSRQLHYQFATKAITCIVNNSFGPFDTFSLEKGKVISNFIKKFTDAKEQNLPYVECFGTGVAKREFIYCKDVARLLALTLEKYDDCTMPINIGSPDEITIKELAETTAELVGYEGEIRWLGGGDGQLRKKLDLTRMNKILLDNKRFDYTPFKDAMFQTILWYYENRQTWMK